MKALKICHFTSVHSNSDIRIFVKECSTLAQAGYEVYLVAQGESRIENGVHVIGLGEMPQGRKQRMTNFAKAIYEKAKSLDCDIYHFHDPELLPYGIKLKRKGKKVIFDSHEDVPAQILDKEWITYPLRKIVSVIYKTYETYACGKFDAVVAATSHIGETFKERAQRVVVVNNYPKLNDIQFHDTPFTERERIVCYAGGIDELRGEKIMVEAMKGVEGTLMIAGDHKKETIDQSPGGKIEYIGYRNRKEIDKLYGQSICGLCVLQPASNYINSQPIKMYEYMAAGLPYICSDFPAWRELTESIGAGIVINPESSEELIMAVNYLFNHLKKAEEMGKAGHEAIIHKYNWNFEKKKLLDLYASFAIEVKI